MVAMVGADHKVHMQKIVVGRDFGDRMEVASGLADGSVIIANPGELAREGVEVDPVPVAEKNDKKK